MTGRVLVVSLDEDPYTSPDRCPSRGWGCYFLPPSGCELQARAALWPSRSALPSAQRRQQLPIVASAEQAGTMAAAAAAAVGRPRERLLYTGGFDFSSDLLDSADALAGGIGDLLLVREALRLLVR